MKVCNTNYTRSQCEAAASNDPNVIFYDDFNGAAGAPAPGSSLVTLSGAASATTVADSSGNYSFTGLSNGSYVVTPSSASYTFMPTQPHGECERDKCYGSEFHRNAELDPVIAFQQLESGDRCSVLYSNLNSVISSQSIAPNGRNSQD